MQLSTRSRSIAFACSGLFVVAACGGNSSAPRANLAPPAQPIPRVNTVVEPNSYDPTQETYPYERSVAPEPFDGLLQPNPTPPPLLTPPAQTPPVSPHP